MSRTFVNVLERVAGIEPAPSAWKAEVLPLNYTRKTKFGGGGWIRTSEALASDLQSDPFSHSGTPPKNSIVTSLIFLSTPRLSVRLVNFGAGERNRTPDRLITNQMLYLLSYASLSGSELYGTLTKHASLFHLSDTSTSSFAHLLTNKRCYTLPLATRDKPSRIRLLSCITVQSKYSTTLCASPPSR